MSSEAKRAKHKEFTRTNRVRQVKTKEVKWCEHIRNWGNAWYFVGTHSSFPVKSVSGEQKVFTEWHICPICMTPAP